MAFRMRMTAKPQAVPLLYHIISPGRYMNALFVSLSNNCSGDSATRVGSLIDAELRWSGIVA